MKLAVLPGDDIGPEITEATLSILEKASTAFGLTLTFDIHEVGMASHRRTGTTLPTAAIEAARTADGIILGPGGMTAYPPVQEGGINIPGTIRKQLELFANLRPARSRSFLPRAHPGLDCLIVRENTEGFYADRNMFAGSGEFMPTPDCALAVRKISRNACRRIAAVAFSLAKQRRKQVTVVGKRHVLQLSDGIFVDEAEAQARAHTDVRLREVDIDAMAAELYISPAQHDIILTTNMFGDILSNAAVAMSGGLGLAAALNAGEHHAAANAGHGSAPDIAGHGIANPTGLILSAAMLLRWLGERRSLASFGEAATSIEAAVDRALESQSARTTDLGGDGTTKTFVAAILKSL
ncbi:isocitrate/isopropylmalate dehydrogenase family protein [Leptospira interrogans]